MKTKTINTKDLSRECWMVQAFGISYCDSNGGCKSKGTDCCGGKEMLETGKNSKGKEIGKDGIK